MELTVVGMTCAHCVHAVTQAVSAIPGASHVAVDLATGHVRFDGTPDLPAVRAAIEEAGYEVR